MQLLPEVAYIFIARLVTSTKLHAETRLYVWNSTKKEVAKTKFLTSQAIFSANYVLTA